MDSRTKRPARRALAVCCLLLAAGAMLPVGSSAATRPARLVSQTSTKDADFARLAELGAAVLRIRTNLGQDPTNTRIQRNLDAAQAEYNALSARLGGAQAPVSDSNPAAPGNSRGGGPPAPPNCMAALTTFSNPTVVTIPAAGANTVTSTIVVSGVGTSLFDVDAITNITHSFNSDLDISLTSPAGTIVTLGTDLGAGNDNIFLNTRWDDDANPGGPVPYTNNNGVASDTLYANNVNNPTLVPEEALGAFIGEDPNGTWTLTVADQFNLDGGSFFWSMDVTTLAMAPTVTAATTFSNPTVVTIPAAGANTLTSTIVVSGVGTSLYDVDAIANITHSFNSDLDVSLTSPAGTIVTLVTDLGAGNDNLFTNTRFNDDANPGGPVPYTNNNGVASDTLYANNVNNPTLVPEEAMAAFIGEDPNGTWTLTVADQFNLDGGSFFWSMDVQTATCAPPAMCVLTCPADINATATDVNGAVVNYPAPTASQCINVVCTPPSGSTFPVGTTVVTCSGDNDVPNATKTTEGGPMPCSESFDTVTAPALPAGWTSTGSGTEPAWVTSVTTPDSAPNDAFAPDIAGIGDTVLDSNPIAVVSAAATVTFRNNFNTEDTFDGMVLEISIGAGPFTDIITAGGSFVTGGYTDTISVNFMSPIAGRQAWSGNSGGYVTTTANLPAAANGQTVVLRWRMATDTTVGATGVRIDTITTTGTNCGGGGGGGTSSCTFNINVGIPFDGCCVDDASGDIFRQVVASVPNTSPLFGYWEYEVAATGEIFTGTALRVAYRPGLSIIMDDNDEATVFLHAEIDFPRNKCRVQVRDLPTSRNFVLRDRNLNNNTCAVQPEE